MRILHLTIRRKWFYLIASGLKVVEYREVKPYWTLRLLQFGIWPHWKKFDEVHLHNGGHFGASLPLIRTKYSHAMTCAPGHVPANGEVLEGPQYAIFLGEILEVRK